MAESAAHLVDRVLPAVPVRQWVLSLPLGLRFALAKDHALLTAVLRVVMRAVLGIQSQRARAFGAGGKCGALTAVQRFGGALNLNVHFHAIVLDGVHVMGEDGRVRLQALPAPTGEERRAWTEAIASRVTRLLRRRGLHEGDDAGCDEAPSALQDCQAASVRNVVAMGPRAGRPLRKIVLSGLARDDGGQTAPQAQRAARTFVSRRHAAPSPRPRQASGAPRRDAPGAYGPEPGSGRCRTHVLGLLHGGFAPRARATSESRRDPSGQGPRGVSPESGGRATRSRRSSERTPRSARAGD